MEEQKRNQLFSSQVFLCVCVCHYNFRAVLVMISDFYWKSQLEEAKGDSFLRAPHCHSDSGSW